MCLFCKNKYNKDIKLINYTNDYICDEGYKYLSKLTNLKELDLWNNNKSDEGLLLYNNHINDEGCKYISTLTNLQILNVSNNNISDKGCKYLFLQTNLVEIYLNNISDNFKTILDIFGSPYKINNGLKIKLFIMKYYFKF